MTTSEASRRAHRNAARPAGTGPAAGPVHALRWIAVGVLALGAANCASPRSAGGGRHPSELKYGVASSPRVIPEGQPVPKGGGRDMIGQPYVVAGRTYVPREGRGYSQEGWASWYGSAFHGRLTANGEVFDRQSIAAAHPTLPLPSYVRVTNVVNGRSMIVRVNDRGPYEGGRLIDVSERVAEALAFRRRGTTRVRVEYVGKASVDGSDDEKLLATLRTGDAPREQAPFQVARFADTAPAGRPTKTSRAKDLPEDAEPARQPASRPAPRKSVASADEPLDIRPAERTELGPLY